MKRYEITSAYLKKPVQGLWRKLILKYQSKNKFRENVVRGTCEPTVVITVSK
jgi:hypothetical protein